MIGQAEKTERPEVAFALTMLALVVVMKAVTLVAMPEPATSVCRMAMSGPLAGNCAD